MTDSNPSNDLEKGLADTVVRIKNRVLSGTAIAQIRRTVSAVFARLKTRLFGTGVDVFYPEKSLSGLFAASSTLQGTPPDKRTLAALLKIAEGYLDSQEKLAQARVINAAQSALLDPAGDFDNKIKKEMDAAVEQTITAVTTVVEAESTRIRNLGALEGIVKANAIMGVSDPAVVFIGVLDAKTCSECRRLHWMPDGVTPRVWKLSEVGSGYHRKGDPNPKLGGLHPRCRCLLHTVLPGYGFVNGRARFVSHGHNELLVQRGPTGERLTKYEREGRAHFDALGPKLDQNAKDMRDKVGTVVNDKTVGMHPKCYANKIAAQPHLHRLTVNFPGKVLNNISADGKMKNQFATPDSQGDYNPEFRRTVESRLFNISEHAPGTERPIYGAVQFNDSRFHGPKVHKGGAPDYGNCYFVLKDHVKDRASVCMGDSYGAKHDDVFRFKDMDAMLHRTTFWRDEPKYDVEHGYHEAQIHGGVHLPDDVAELHLAHSYKGAVSPEEMDAAVAMGKKYGIPVFLHHKMDYSDWGVTQLHDPAAPNKA